MQYSAKGTVIMASSISRIGGHSPLQGTSGIGASAGSAPSLISQHAGRASKGFEANGNAPVSSRPGGGFGGGSVAASDSDNQLTQDVHHVRQTTPTEGANPVLAGSLGSGSLLGSFVSTGV